MPDNSVDSLITDPPYGVTGLEWDNDNIEWLSEAFRIVKDEGVIVSFGTQPFTTKIINKYNKEFRYCWVWNKSISGNPLIAKYQPLKIHEDIIVLSKKPYRYNPIMRKGELRKKGGGRSNLLNMDMSSSVSDDYYPVSILNFSNAFRGDHPTQKPLDLLRYLVETYSKINDVIYDPFMGSGTTARACKDLGRNYIGSEISKEYCEIAEKRLRQEVLF